MTSLPDYQLLLRDGFQKMDYSQWERCNRRNCGAVFLPHVRGAGTSQRTAPFRGKDTGGVSITFVCHEKDRRAKYESSTTHEKSAVVPGRRKNTKLDVISLKKHNTKPLKLLIELKKQMINELESHSSTLMKNNSQLAEELESTDRDSFSCAWDCLTQHRQLGNYVINIKCWYHSELKKVKEDLKHTEEDAKKHVYELQEQLTGLKAEVVKAHAKLLSLKAYEKMEHPVNAQKVAELEWEIKKLKKIQQDEYENVTLLFKTEMRNLEKRSKHKEEQILSQIAEEKLASIPTVFIEIAAHNYTLRREIDFLKMVLKELEEESCALEKDVDDLQRLKRSVKKARFCEVVPQTERCTPDMDVTVDIPKEDWVPI